MCSKSIYPELTENLVITGSRSLLVGKIPSDLIESTKKLLGNIIVTEDKYRLPCCLELLFILIKVNTLFITLLLKTITTVIIMEYMLMVY